MKEHSAVCVRLFTYEAEQSDLSYSLGPKDNATIAPVELHSKFEYVDLLSVAQATQ